MSSRPKGDPDPLHIFQDLLLCQITPLKLPLSTSTLTLSRVHVRHFIRGGARSLFLSKGHFHYNIRMSVGKFLRGTKFPDQGNRGHSVHGLYSRLLVKYCSCNTVQHRSHGANTKWIWAIPWFTHVTFLRFWAHSLIIAIILYSTHQFSHSSCIIPRPYSAQNNHFRNLFFVSYIKEKSDILCTSEKCNMSNQHFVHILRTYNKFL